MRPSVAERFRASIATVLCVIATVADAIPERATDIVAHGDENGKK
jgi:hypothetical protein